MKTYLRTPLHKTKCQSEIIILTVFMTFTEIEKLLMNFRKF